MEKFLKSLHNKFLKFEKRWFFINAKKHSASLKGLKLSDKILGKFYDNYYKSTFVDFLCDIKTIIYSKSAFDFIVIKSFEDWDLWTYLKFLKNEKIIKIHRTGKVSLLKKEIKKIIPKPQSAKEIKRKVERKLRVRAKEKEPVTNLFEKFQKFSAKTEWDQMPISAGSAFFVVERILKLIPKNGKFLFVGDDDFVSVILSLADPKIESLVVDSDSELISCIDKLASKFNLKIETKKINITKQKFLGEKFIGFLTTPIYTESGVREFVKFGKNQLGKDGGLGFLIIGDESIGNRFLFLQDFFTKNNLVIEELITDRIYYPFTTMWPEDKEIVRRLSLMIDKKIIESSPKLGASLYVFGYLPKRPKKIKFKKPIYAYL